MFCGFTWTVYRVISGRYEIRSGMELRNKTAAFVSRFYMNGLKSRVEQLNGTDSNHMEVLHVICIAI